LKSANGWLLGLGALKRGMRKGAEMTFVELAQARIRAREDSTQNIIAYLRILRHILQRKIMTVSLTVLSEMPLAD